MKDILKQYIGRDIPAEALAEIKSRHGTTVVRLGGVSRDVLSPVTLAERIGEVRRVTGVNCTFAVQDGRVPEWDAQTGVWMGYTTHPDVFRAIIPESMVLGPGDYCGYCGYYNGPHGEDRVGWDCRYCGGN